MEKAGLPGDDWVMSSYMSNLASRALGISESIRPRIPALFEPVKALPGDLDIGQIDLGQIGSKTAEQISDDLTDGQMSGRNRVNSQAKGFPKRANIPFRSNSALKEPLNGLSSLETSLSSVHISEKNKKLEDEAPEEVYKSELARPGEPIGEEPFIKPSSRQTGVGSERKDAKAFELASIGILRDLSGIKDDQAPERNYGKLNGDMPKNAKAPRHENIRSNIGSNIGSNTRSRPVEAISPSINPVGPEIEVKSDNSISEISKPKTSTLYAESHNPKSQSQARPDQSVSMRIMPSPMSQRERSEMPLSPVKTPIKSSMILPASLEPREFQIDQPSIGQPSIIRKHTSNHPKTSNEEVSVEGPEGQPVIRVTIGRIEVKAVSRPETKAKAPAPKAQSTSLEEYLRSIRGGSR